MSLVLIFFLGRGTHVRSDKNVNLSNSTSPLAFYNVPSSGMHVVYTFCIFTLFTFFTGLFTGIHQWKVLQERRKTGCGLIKIVSD